MAGPARVLPDAHLDEVVDELLDTVTTLEDVHDTQHPKDDLRESIHLDRRSMLDLVGDPARWSRDGCAPGTSPAGEISVEDI